MNAKEAIIELMEKLRPIAAKLIPWRPFGRSPEMLRARSLTLYFSSKGCSTVSSVA